MSDYMHLIGSEDVQRAGGRMVSPAEDMQRAANSMSETVDRLIRALDEHAARIEAAARGAL